MINHICYFTIGYLHSIWYLPAKIQLFLKFVFFYNRVIGVFFIGRYKLFYQKLEGDPSNLVIEIDDQITATDNDLNQVIKYLNKATLDELMMRQLEYEKEQERGYKDYQEELSESKQREEEAKRQKEEAQCREEEAQRQKEEAMLKLAFKMKKYGEPIAEIAKETGLTVSTIETL